MPRLARSTIGLLALGALGACHRPNGPFTTGNAAAYTPDARAVDVLWMIALPPVTVLAPTKRVVPSAKAARIP